MCFKLLIYDSLVDFTVCQPHLKYFFVLSSIWGSFHSFGLFYGGKTPAIYFPKGKFMEMMLVLMKIFII